MSDERDRTHYLGDKCPGGHAPPPATAEKVPPVVCTCPPDGMLDRGCNVHASPPVATTEKDKDIEYLLLCLQGISHWTGCREDALCMRCRLEKYDGFNGMVTFIKERLEEFYPESVFDGSSGDSGPVFVVALRKAIGNLAPPAAPVAEKRR